MKSLFPIITAAAGLALFAAPSAFAADPAPQEAEQPAGPTMHLTVVLADGGG